MSVKELSLWEVTNLQN